MTEVKRGETLADRAQALAKEFGYSLGPLALMTGRMLIEQGKEDKAVREPLEEIDRHDKNAIPRASEDYTIAPELRRGTLFVSKRVVKYGNRRGTNNSRGSWTFERLVDLNARRRSGDPTISIFTAKGKVQK